ncbi:hypothetical protein PBI_SCTP2_529 [Salicola phage SCTP-2]|nr:hypothetical protein PBI_SCTP2_529 [Salicola phage SCTP-2]
MTTSEQFQTENAESKSKQNIDNNSNNIETFYKRFEPKFAHHNSLSTHIKKENVAIRKKVAKQKMNSEDCYDLIRISEGNDFELNGSNTIFSTPDVTESLIDRITKKSNNLFMTKPQKGSCMSPFMIQGRKSRKNNLTTITGEFSVDFNFILNCEGFFEFMIYFYDLLYHNPADQELIDLYHNFVVNSLSITDGDKKRTSRYDKSCSIVVFHFSEILYKVIKNTIGNYSIPSQKYPKLYKIDNNENFDQSMKNTKAFDYNTGSTKFVDMYEDLITNSLLNQGQSIKYNLDYEYSGSNDEKEHWNYEQLFNDASSLFENLLKETNYRSIISKGMNPLKDKNVIERVKQTIDTNTVLTVISPTYTFIDWSNVKQFHKQYYETINEFFAFALDGELRESEDVVNENALQYLRRAIQNDLNISGNEYISLDILEFYMNLVFSTKELNDKETFCLSLMKSNSALSTQSSTMLLSSTGFRNNKNDIGKDSFENHIPSYIIDAYTKDINCTTDEHCRRMYTFYNHDAVNDKNYSGMSYAFLRKNISNSLKVDNQFIIEMNPTHKRKINELREYFKSRNIDMKINNKISHTQIEQDYPFIVNFKFNNTQYNPSGSNIGLDKLEHFFMLLSKYYDNINFKFNIGVFDLRANFSKIKNGILCKLERINENLEFFKELGDIANKDYFDVFDIKVFKPKINHHKWVFKNHHKLFYNLFERLFGDNNGGIYDFSVMVETDSRKFMNMAKLGDVKPNYIKLNIENLDEIYQLAVIENKI